MKWVSISQGLPLLCLRAPDEAENRQVEGLKERSRMEGSLHTTPLYPAGKTYTCKGPGGGVSPEGQVARMPVDVRVHFSGLKKRGAIVVWYNEATFARERTI